MDKQLFWVSLTPCAQGMMFWFVVEKWVGLLLNVKVLLIETLLGANHLKFDQLMKKIIVLNLLTCEKHWPKNYRVPNFLHREVWTIVFLYIFLLDNMISFCFMLHICIAPMYRDLLIFFTVSLISVSTTSACPTWHLSDLNIRSGLNYANCFWS